MSRRPRARLTPARRGSTTVVVVAAATLMPSDFEAKPFVKWVGGKRQLLPSISAATPVRTTPGNQSGVAVTRSATAAALAHVM